MNEIIRSIEWPSECAFKKLSADGKDLYTEPFKNITSKTFSDENLLKLLSDKINCTANFIIKYFSDTDYIFRLIRSITKNNLHTAIIMNDVNLLRKYLSHAYDVDDIVIKLACMNSIDGIILHELYDYVIKSGLNKNIFLDPMFLAISLESDNIIAYDFLVEIGCRTSLNILNIAVKTTHISIVKSLDENYAPTDETVKNAIIHGSTEITNYILESFLSTGKIFDKNLVAYLLIDSKISTIKYLHEKKLVDWHTDLYYSAILSGSMDVIKYVDNFYPNIHKNKILDKPIGDNVGQKTKLTLDIMYTLNKNKYFSHAMNYAIQSNSLKMVTHIHSMGYGLSISNIITAIKSKITILEYIVKNYNKKIPAYILCYFSVNSIVKDKFEKLHVIFTSNKIDLLPDKLDKNFIQLENQHINLINNNKTVEIENMYVCDYLFNYQVALADCPGIKFNHRLYVITSYAIIYKNINLLKQILLKYNGEYDLQFIRNIVVLNSNGCGDLREFIEIYSVVYPKLPFKISQSIWSILISFGSIEKIIICKLYDNIIEPFVYQLIHANGNATIIKLFEKYKIDVNPEFILKMSDENIIMENIDKIPMTKNNINKLLNFDSEKITPLIKNYIYSNNYNIREYIQHCDNHKLMVAKFILDN